MKVQLVYLDIVALLALFTSPSLPFVKKGFFVLIPRAQHKGAIMTSSIFPEENKNKYICLSVDNKD